MGSVPTGCAEELGLGLPVLFGAMPTRWTGPTRIPRINEMDRNTVQLRFVGYKLLQLPEGPTMQCCALWLPSPDPRANMRQVFQRYLPLRAFCQQHKLFGDLMIDRRCKAPFFAAQLFELALRGFRAFGLELGSQTTAAMAHTQHGFAAIDVPVAIGGNGLHTKINAQRAVHIQRRGFFHVADRQQVKLTVDVGKVGFAFAGMQAFHLPASGHKRNGLSAVDRPDRHGQFVQVPRQNPLIVGNTAVRPEYALDLAIQFVRVGHLAQAAYRQLCRQPKRFAARLVTQLVQIELPEGLRLPRGLAHRGTGGVRNFQCSQ